MVFDEEEKFNIKERSGEFPIDDSEESEAYPTSIESQGAKSDKLDLQRCLSDVHLSDIAKLDIFENMKICGDILFRIYHKGSINCHFICRFGVNTSFLNTGDNILPITELDP